MIIKYIILIPMALLKGFVSSLRELVWTLAGIVLLNMLLLNYLANDYPISVSDLFLEITQILSQHIVLFLFIFWVYYSYFELRDLSKDIRGGKEE